MKKIIFFLITLLSISAYSQTQNKAKALLDEVAQKVEAYENIFIEFKHKFDNIEANVKISQAPFYCAYII